MSENHMNQNITINTTYAGDRGNLDWVSSLDRCTVTMLESFKTAKNLTFEPCCDRYTGDQRLIHLYTHNVWYKAINAIIEQKEIPYYGIIQSMTDYISEGNSISKEKFYYRGLSNLAIDENVHVIELADFTSMTTDIDVAEQFAQGGVILKVAKTSRCISRSVVDISRYPEEKEVLMIPFTYVANFKHEGTYKSCQLYTCNFIEPTDIEYTQWIFGTHNVDQKGTWICLCICFPCLLPIFAFCLVLFVPILILITIVMPLSLLVYLYMPVIVAESLVMYIDWRVPVEFGLKQKFYYSKKYTTKVILLYLFLWVTMIYNVVFLVLFPFKYLYASFMNGVFRNRPKE